MTKKNNEYIGNNRRGENHESDLSLVLTGNKLPLSILGGIVLTLISGIIAGTIFWMNISNRLDVHLQIQKKDEALLHSELSKHVTRITRIEDANKFHISEHRRIENRIREIEDTDQRIWQQIKREHK